MDKYLEEIKDLHCLFIEEDIPSLPIIHIFLKNKIKKNITLNFYFSFLIKKFLNNDISGEYVIENLNDFKQKHGYKFDEKILEQTDLILDTWMIKHGII